MTPAFVDRYLRQLESGLALYPGRREDVIDEVRDHLLESVERGQARGLAPDDAAQRAVEAFGDPEVVARRLMAHRVWMRTRVMLPLALITGLSLAIIDNQPNWDDTGISAFAVVCATGLLSLIEPTRPWLWATAVGGWFPLLAITLHGNYGAILALFIAIGAAYAGSFARRAMGS